MKTDEEITIILSTPEAIQFREFQRQHKYFMEFKKFHETFATMAKSGVFDVQFGKVTLHFAKNDLQKVTIEEDKWKKLA